MLFARAVIRRMKRTRLPAAGAALLFTDTANNLKREPRSEGKK